MATYGKFISEDIKCSIQFSRRTGPSFIFILHALNIPALTGTPSLVIIVDTIDTAFLNVSSNILIQSFLLRILI